MIPSASDLAYFIEIARTQNLSRAAERLGVSQPSLSLSIRRIENSVGAELLIRGKRGVVLTPAGKQFLAHARNMMEAWDAIRARTRASMTEVQGSFTIGCHASVARAVLPQFLPQLLRLYPKLDIALHHDLSRRITEDVISFRADIGIVVNPVQHPDLVVRRLYEDEFTAWAVPGAQKDILICDPDLMQSQYLMKKMKGRSSFARIVTSGSLETIAALAASGCGTALLPASIARRTGEKLKKVPGAPVYRDEHCLLYRVESRSVKAVQTICSTIMDCLGSKSG